METEILAFDYRIANGKKIKVDGSIEYEQAANRLVLKSGTDTLGYLPKIVVKGAGWWIADWKKDARYTEASIEIMASEMWKQLNQIKDWDLLAEFGTHPLQTVKNIYEEVQKKFGVRR
jgi:hypothetical protein